MNGTPSSQPPLLSSVAALNTPPQAQENPHEAGGVTDEGVRVEQVPPQPATRGLQPRTLFFDQPPAGGGPQPGSTVRPVRPQPAPQGLQPQTLVFDQPPADQPEAGGGPQPGAAVTQVPLQPVIPPGYSTPPPSPRPQATTCTPVLEARERRAREAGPQTDFEKKSKRKEPPRIEEQEPPWKRFWDNNFPPPPPPPSAAMAVGA